MTMVAVPFVGGPSAGQSVFLDVPDGGTPPPAIVVFSDVPADQIGSVPAVKNLYILESRVHEGTDAWAYVYERKTNAG